MHNIYENAKLTIVAAAGVDVDAGLPGVSLGSRKAQPIFQVQDLRLAIKLDNLTTVLNRSHWSSRGWIMQEGLLSCRKLVFTSDQVYFSCEHGNCCEDHEAPIHEFYPAKRVLDEDPYRLKVYDRTSWGIYKTIVSDYTKRSLSYENDVLNAFHGVSEILKTEIFGNRRSLACIPLCILDVGLLWNRCENLACPCGTSGLRPRQGSAHGMKAFPSWSWAGWVGHIEYDDLFENLPERIVSRVDWLDAKDGVTSLPRETTGKPPQSWQLWCNWERQSETDSIHYYVRKKGDPRKWFCYPMDFESQPLGDPVNPETGALQFVADVACLTVSKKRHSLQSKRGSNYVISPKDPLVIVDNDGIQVGIVFEDEIILDGSLPNTYNFIKLSQTIISSTRLKYDPAWDQDSGQILERLGEPAIHAGAKVANEDKIFDCNHYDWKVSWCLYNVIMVEWREQRAYRIGFGKIHIHAFDNATPERRTISLY